MTTRTSTGIYLQVLEPAAAVATGIEIDVYDAANYAKMLDTLEGARNTSYQKQLNQAGAGSFKLNRHDAKATAQNTQKGNLCKVKINGVYRGAFFMEETVRDFADPSGAGAEDNEIKGRGVLAYMERAVVYPTGWPATKLPDVTYTGVTRGAILKDQIDQAKARGGLGAMTYDFTATVDSIGNPWTDTNTLTLHIGLNLFDLVLQLAALGTDFYMDPNLGFHAYQSLSIDRTGASGAAAVVFRQGKHIGQKALTVDEHNSAVRSRLLVEGSGNNIQEVVDSPVETDTSVGRREGYLSYTSSGDTQALNDAGAALLQQLAMDAQPLTMTITHGPSHGLSVEGTYEDNSTPVAYTGAWTMSANAGDSGGTHTYSNTTGNTATLNFVGSGVTLVWLGYFNNGIASIKIDGSVVDLLDTYSAAFAFQQQKFYPVAAGFHSISVTVSGTKNPSATDFYFQLDAFIVAPGAATGDYEPFVDYDVGDYVLVDVPGAYDLAALRLVSLTIDQIEGGDFTVTVDLNSVYLEYLIRVGQKAGALSGGSSSSTSGPSGGGGSAPAAGAGRVAAAVGDSPGYLYDKISAGAGIIKTLTGSAPAETVTLALSTGAIPESAINGLVIDLALKAPLASPAFTGSPTFPAGSVAAAALAAIAESGVTNLVSDLALKAPLASPAFTGTATAEALAISGDVTAQRIGGIFPDQLINATSTGDAGNAASHFTGTALESGWGTEGTAPVITVKNSLALVAPAAGAEAGIWEAYTPSGAFRVEARVMLATNNNQIILAVKDSSSGTTSAGNWIQFGYTHLGVVFLASVDSGVETNRQLITDARFVSGVWTYLAIARDGSNNFTGYYSLNRVTWTSIGSWTKTLTVAKLGRRDVGASLKTSFDFIDVVS